MGEAGRSVGVLECWSVGVLECWSVGVLECWSTGRWQALRVACSREAAAHDSLGRSPRNRIIKRSSAEGAKEMSRFCSPMLTEARTFRRAFSASRHFLSDS